jgi:hypothetical protein
MQLGPPSPLGILINVIFKLSLLFATVASLPWVENDYNRALAEAKSRHVPVFVELWAPW